jgi:tetratricopeptide (TPR) repeat protein
MSRLFALSALTLTAFSVAASQAEPKRPPMFASADTNDPQAYYAYGLSILNTKPKIAADAFYWSTQLNPHSGEAFYARRVALLLTDMRRLIKYWDGDRNTLRSAEIKRIDSLYLHAMTLNPFLYEKLDGELFKAIIEELVAGDAARAGISAGELQFAVDGWLSRADAGTKAWRFYSEGRFPEALDYYARAIKSARIKYGYRSMRGRLFFQLNQPDSALAELKQAVEEARTRDAKDFQYVYQSKALMEHSVGLAHERLGARDAAKEAYGRALQEDLAYSPAHTRLGYMALESGDTTTAISEFDLAVQLREKDVAVRYQYAYVLHMAGKQAEAAQQMEKTIALNPWYAASYSTLGAIHERQGKPAEAVAAYKKFLAMASQVDPRRDEITKKVQSLSATGF